MRYCSHCGWEQKQLKPFCAHCGAPQKLPKTVKTSRDRRGAPPKFLLPILLVGAGWFGWQYYQNNNAPLNSADLSGSLWHVFASPFGNEGEFGYFEFAPQGAGAVSLKDSPSGEAWGVIPGSFSGRHLVYSTEGPNGQVRIETDVDGSGTSMKGRMVATERNANGRLSAPAYWPIRAARAR